MSEDINNSNEMKPIEIDENDLAPIVNESDSINLNSNESEPHNYTEFKVEKTKDGKELEIIESKKNDTTEKFKREIAVYGVIVSRLDYPEVIKYGSENIRVSPRARLPKIQEALLSKDKAGIIKLPKGLFFVKNSEVNDG
jgi:hypothetical protein